jgi:type I restriction enzyme S subunit
MMPFRLYSTDTALPSMTQTALNEHLISIPSSSEQTTIANFLDTQTAKIDTLISKAKSAITLLQERRSALISAVVTGKIDVRELA